MIEIRTDLLSAEEKETVAYLEFRKQDVDERGMLARVVYNMISFGKITSREVGEILGVYDPEGIQLDDENEEITPLEETQVIPEVEQKMRNNPEFEEAFRQVEEMYKDEDGDDSAVTEEKSEVDVTPDPMLEKPAPEDMVLEPTEEEVQQKSRDTDQTDDVKESEKVKTDDDKDDKES